MQDLAASLQTRQHNQASLLKTLGYHRQAGSHASEQSFCQRQADFYRMVFREHEIQCSSVKVEFSSQPSYLLGFSSSRTKSAFYQLLWQIAQIASKRYASSSTLSLPPCSVDLRFCDLSTISWKIPSVFSLSFQQALVSWSQTYHTNILSAFSYPEANLLL